ncbi:MCE family protein [Actinocorallia longicatena]|uniref:MCE family protein n=1 Tax=Actinocorallia longicatena TaxID=111803 RepID=A0ABP6QKA4_9ACTN
MRVPFREKNPTVLGLVSLASIALGITVALNIDNIPLVTGGTTYHAEFAEAAGLRDGEEVRIAGVKVGRVTKLDLEGDHVRVDFKVDDGVPVGNATRVEIKIKTLLGSHYLALDPRGPEKQRPSVAIPRSRTTTPYEVVPAIADLSKNISKIDDKALATAFDTMSETFKNSPDEIKASLKGLQRLSKTISSRDDELAQLITRAKDVTGVLAERKDDFVKVVERGDQILQAVQNRRAVIHQLLLNTYAVSQQINAVIDENEDELKPLLKNLQKVAAVLLKNKDNLDRDLQLMAVYGRQFTDATGSGRWFDSYIQNFIPIPASIGSPSKDKKTKKSADDPLPLLP